MKQPKVVHIQYMTTAVSPDYRLHQIFLKSGIESRIVSLMPKIQADETVLEAGRKGRWKAKIDTKIQSRLTRKFDTRSGSFSYPVLGSNLSKMKQVEEADIIYLHWVLNGFMSLSNIEQLARLNKPIVVYMHDTWAITGGCHHFLECDKFKTACTRCPLFENAKQNDLSSKEFAKKLRLYSKYDNLYFVAPSKWLFEAAKVSALTKNKQIFHIPNILEEEVFQPVDKKVAKKLLGFEEGSKVIAFGAISIESPYKGWIYLQEALEILKEQVEDQNVNVLIFGSSYNKRIASAIPFKTKFAGFLGSDYATSLMYNAADVFVAPSLADNLPYTVLEAESCGTPVAAFRTGGIPEMIAHKQNGYLADHKDPTDLAKGIRFCLESEIKGYRLPEFESKKVLEQYIELMDKIGNMSKTT